MRLLMLVLWLLLFIPVSAQEVTTNTDDLLVINSNNTSQLTSLAMLGRGRVNAVAFSPNGRLLAVGTSVGIWIYDLTTADAEPVFHETEIEDEVYALDFNSDGSLIAFGTRKGGINAGRLGDDLSINNIRSLTGRCELKFQPNGKYLAYVAPNNEIALWDSQTEEILTLGLHGDDSNCLKLAFSGDGNALIVTDVTTTRVWDVGTLSEIGHYPTTDAYTSYAAGFNALHQPVVVRLAYPGFYDVPDLFRADVLEVEANPVPKPPMFNLEGEPATLIEISSEGSLLITGSGYFGETEVSLRIWDLLSGDLLARINFFYDIYAVSLNSDNTQIAIASRDGVVRIWDTERILKTSELAEDTAETTLSGFFPWAAEIAFSSDSQYLIAVSPLNESNSIRIWDVMTRELIDLYTSSGDSVSSVVANPIASSFITAGQTYDAPMDWYHGFSLWDYAGSTQRQLGTIDSPATDLAISPDGETLAIATFTNIELWSVIEGKRLRIIEGDSTSVETVAYSPTEPYIASGNHDGILNLWDVENGSLIKSIAAHDGTVHEIAFSPDGSVLASAGGDGTVRFWHVSDLQLTAEYNPEYPGTSFHSVAFHPDGSILAATVAYPTDNYRTMLIDPTNGSELAGRFGHNGFINDAIFSSNGKLLATNGSDGTIHLWGVPLQRTVLS